MANKYIKRCPISLAIRKIQLKAMITNYYVPIRMAKIKNTANTPGWPGCVLLNSSYIPGRNGTTTLDNGLVAFGS